MLFNYVTDMLIFAGLGIITGILGYVTMREMTTTVQTRYAAATTIGVVAGLILGYAAGVSR